MSGVDAHAPVRAHPFTRARKAIEEIEKEAVGVAR